MAARGALSSALTQGGGSDGGRAGHNDVAMLIPCLPSSGCRVSYGSGNAGEATAMKIRRPADPANKPK